MGIFLQSDKIEKLDEIQDGLSYTIGEPSVSINRLMNNKFICKNTDFDTWENFLSAAGIKNEKDLEKENCNEFIKLHTRFKDWEEMLIVSANEYASSHEDK